MIDLSELMVPNNMEEELLDFGFLQRPSSGASTIRVDRPGSRMKATFSFPPMRTDDARALMPLLKRAVREGLRIKWPLVDISQGVPGNPVVDGDDQAGTTLAVRGFNPGYQVKTGYVFHIEDGDGNRYWHEVQAPVIANDDGEAELDIEPPLRAPFEDGDTIEMAKPTFEGWLIGNPTKATTVDRLVAGTRLTIEEAG